MKPFYNTFKKIVGVMCSFLLFTQGIWLSSREDRRYYLASYTCIIQYKENIHGSFFKSKKKILKWSNIGAKIETLFLPYDDILLKIFLFLVYLEEIRVLKIKFFKAWDWAYSTRSKWWKKETLKGDIISIWKNFSNSGYRIRRGLLI
jgi:hypothetical protein